MERRGLVPIEIAAILIAATLASWDPPPLGAIPIMLPLMVTASIARWACGKSFGAVVRGPASYLGIAALTGLGALILALALGTPIAEAMSTRPVVWASFPMVRGNASALWTFAVIVAALAAASELVLRAWVVERVLELGGSAAVAVLVGAIAEALLVPGPIEARFGGFVMGIALGWMYIAAGRNVAVTLVARLAFGLGALALEMLEWVS
ncbi:hypothetical protein BH11MYX1_BH11MYX1_18360 [soil metagenome]